MAVEVMRSHDCLRNRFFFADAYRSPAPKPKRSPRNRRSPGNRDRSGGDHVQDERRRGRLVVKSLGKSLIMEEVTILKRGEGLKKPAEASPKSDDSVLSATVSPRSDNTVLSPTVSPRTGDDAVISPTASPRTDDAVLCSTEPLGPDPEMVPKQIRLVDAKPAPAATGSCPAFAPHAGYCAVVSPSPSSVPKPMFLSKVRATKGLWYLLHLDLP